MTLTWTGTFIVIQLITRLTDTLVSWVQIDTGCNWFWTTEVRCTALIHIWKEQTKHENCFMKRNANSLLKWKSVLPFFTVNLVWLHLGSQLQGIFVLSINCLQMRLWKGRLCSRPLQLKLGGALFFLHSWIYLGAKEGAQLEIASIKITGTNKEPNKWITLLK